MKKKKFPSPPEPRTMSFCSFVCESIDPTQFQKSLKNACQELKSESSAINKPLAQQLHTMFSCGEDVDQLSCKQMCTDLKPMLCSDQFDPMAKYFCNNTVLKEEEKHTVGQACQSLKNLKKFKNICKSIKKIGSGRVPTIYPRREGGLLRNGNSLYRMRSPSIVHHGRNRGHKARFSGPRIT